MQPAQREQVSAWAIAALVLGILGVVFVSRWGGIAIFAVVCGHAGLGDVKHKSRSGRGLAIAGLVLGYFGLVLLVTRILTDNI